MSFMNMRFVTKTYLMWQRFEVFLAVMLPMFLIFESALANGTVYNGGPLDFHDMRSWIAFGRGLFFEVLTYALAKLVKLMVQRGKRWMIVMPLLVALWCVLVSAGNNVGWVLSGGDFQGMLVSLASFLPAWMLLFYKLGLGLLLPISVFVLALVDIGHLVEEALNTAHLDNQALKIHESEMHRTAYLKSQGKQKQKISEAYDATAEKRADAYIKKVDAGDMSFGANEQKAIAAPGVRRVAGPVAGAGGGLPGQAPFTGQVAPAPTAQSGNTQNIVIPPPGPGQANPPKKGILSGLFR